MFGCPTCRSTVMRDVESNYKRRFKVVTFVSLMSPQSDRLNIRDSET